MNLAFVLNVMVEGYYENVITIKGNEVLMGMPARTRTTDMTLAARGNHGEKTASRSRDRGKYEVVETRLHSPNRDLASLSDAGLVQSRGIICHWFKGCGLSTPFSFMYWII